MIDQYEVDKLILDNQDTDAYNILDEYLPKHRAKLDRLDKRLRDILQEIQSVFPDAQYYTASGGFNLILGNTHSEDITLSSQQQRVAWSGKGRIGDGDW